MSKKLEHLWVKHLDFTPLNGLFFFFFFQTFIYMVFRPEPFNEPQKKDV